MSCPRCNMMASALQLCHEAFQHMDDGDLIARAEKLAYDVLTTPVDGRKPSGITGVPHLDAVNRYQSGHLDRGLCVLCPKTGVVRAYIQDGKIQERLKLGRCWWHYVHRRARGLAYRLKNPRKMVADKG